MALKDLVVLVTGGARGMGREYVRGFLAQGAKVVATDLSWIPSGYSGDDFAFDEEIRDNPNVHIDVMDITVDYQVRSVYERAMERFGTMDVIINNAGMRMRDLYPPHGVMTTLETEPGEWERMFATHVFGTLRVIKQFSQPMLAKGRGSIINVSSGGYNASRPDSREMPYQSAKAALVTMTLYLANELKPRGIAANIILPGHTRTTGSDEMDVIKREMRVRELPAGTPIMRPLRYNPDNVVPLALFLAEQDAEGVTGQVIDALSWNQAHGLGGPERWAYAEDWNAPDVRRPTESHR